MKCKRCDHELSIVRCNNPSCIDIDCYYCDGIRARFACPTCEKYQKPLKAPADKLKIIYQQLMNRMKSEIV